MKNHADKTEITLSLEVTQRANDGERTASLTEEQRQALRTHALSRLPRNSWRPFTPLPKEIDPDMVPGCTLQAVVGTGGMGTVYLARQNALNRQVAVKLLNAKVSDDPVIMGRLRQEAQIMGTLTHPNLVGCHDIIVSKIGACLLMEYIPGHLNGRNIVRLLGPMPERYVLQVMLAVAKGLAYAYEKGFTHRDVKPDNLLFAFEGDRPPKSYQELFESPDFRVALCDFGIAATKEKMKDLGQLHVDEKLPMDDSTDGIPEEEDSPMVVGSPLYMAPEQAVAPESVDCRSDIYSLGATAFYLLTGTPPFPGKTMEEVLEVKTHSDLPTPIPPPPLPPVDPSLARTIMKMGANLQDARYQNYPQLLARLETLCAPYSSNLSFRIFLRRYRKFFRRLGITALVLAFLGILGIHGYTKWLEHYQERLFESTVNLASWTGALSSWRQTFDGGDPRIIANGNSGAISTKELLDPGDSFRISLEFQDVGSVVILLHAPNEPEKIFAKITCYRGQDGNAVRLATPRGLPGNNLADLPILTGIPDERMTWICLRILFQEQYCVIWDQDMPLGICHFSSEGLTSPKAQVTIDRVNCTQIQFTDFARLRDNFPVKSKNRNNNSSENTP